MTIRQAVVAAYAKRYDELAELGQELVGLGKYDEAEAVHGAALIVIGAYSSEDTDPKPVPVDLCPECKSLLALSQTRRIA